MAQKEHDFTVDQRKDLVDIAGRIGLIDEPVAAAIIVHDVKPALTDVVDSFTVPYRPKLIRRIILIEGREFSMFCTRFGSGRRSEGNFGGRDRRNNWRRGRSLRKA